MTYKMLTGDVNWQEYGGTFYKVEYKGYELEHYSIYEVINLHYAFDPTYKHEYLVQYGSITLKDYSEEQVSATLKSCGWSAEEATELMKVEALWVYGYGRVGELLGNNLKVLIKEAS